MRRYLIALLALLLLPLPVLGQGIPNSATVVANCGTPPSGYTAGQNRPLLQDTTGTQCTGASNPGSPTTVSPAALTPVAGRQTLTSLGSAVALTPPGTATVALVTVADTSAAVRFTYDGTTPTPTIGQSMQPSEHAYIKVANLAAVQFIQEGAGSAQIDVDYFK